MNAAGPWMERSTCDSAAKIHHGARAVVARSPSTSAESPMSPRTNRCRAIAAHRLQIAEVAGVGELVQITTPARRLGKPIDDEVGADESGAAGDEDHGVAEAIDGADARRRRTADFTIGPARCGPARRPAARGTPHAP